jgi:hypothetical protein
MLRPENNSYRQISKSDQFASWLSSKVRPGLHHRGHQSLSLALRLRSGEKEDSVQKAKRDSSFSNINPTLNCVALAACFYAWNILLWPIIDFVDGRGHSGSPLWATHGERESERIFGNPPAADPICRGAPQVQQPISPPTPLRTCNYGRASRLNEMRLIKPFSCTHNAMELLLPREKKSIQK